MLCTQVEKEHVLKEVVMVFWLVLGGTSQTGLAIHPIPFMSQEECEYSAARAMSDYPGPKIQGHCFPQPMSDVARWVDGHGNFYNGEYGQVE